MFKKLENRFQSVLGEFLASPAMAHVGGGHLTVDEYRSFVKQTYYYVRENPQLQALATVFFRGGQRDMVLGFYQHAMSEIGHEQLALNDFITLGGEASQVPYKNPLPATTALTSYAFYQIYNGNPLGYLGYLYFLEFLPTLSGDAISNQLLGAGVPEGALTFLRDHIEIDKSHNRLMKRYAEKLVASDADVDCIEYAMKTTSYLYAKMIEASVEDAKSPKETGWNWEELKADGKIPDDISRKISVVA